MIKYNNHD